MLGKRNPVKVTDQKALEPSVPPPNPSRPRRLQAHVQACLFFCVLERSGTVPSNEGIVRSFRHSRAAFEQRWRATKSTAHGTA
jgi:hypothetical protein